MAEGKSGKRKIYFTIGGDKNGSPKVAEQVVSSGWNPGRTNPSKKFKNRKI